MRSSSCWRPSGVEKLPRADSGISSSRLRTSSAVIAWSPMRTSTCDVSAGAATEMAPAARAPFAAFGAFAGPASATDPAPAISSISARAAPTRGLFGALMRAPPRP